MKEVKRTEYGGPEVLRLEEVPVPEPGDDEVLVRVHVASVNAGDWHLMRGDPFPVQLTLGGLRRPKIRTLGTDMAGTVEAVGEKVTSFGPGDAVFGDLSRVGFGAFAKS